MESSSSLWRPGSGTTVPCSWPSVFWGTGASWTHRRRAAGNIIQTHSLPLSLCCSYVHTHLQRPGSCLFLCRALPQPGAGQADGSPSNKDNSMEPYHPLSCIMSVSNNIRSQWNNDTYHQCLLSSFGLLWKVAVCVEASQTLEAASQGSFSLPTDTTLLRHSEQLSTWALNAKEKRMVK